jgi:hypothetical protein
MKSLLKETLIALNAQERSQGRYLKVPETLSMLLCGISMIAFDEMFTYGKLGGNVTREPIKLADQPKHSISVGSMLATMDKSIVNECMYTLLAQLSCDNLYVVDVAIDCLSLFAQNCGDMELMNQVRNREIPLCWKASSFLTSYSATRALSK